VANVLCGHRNTFIVFVDSQEVKDRFFAISNFPRVIGAIDATHIPIVKPKDNSEAHINRKRLLTLLFLKFDIFYVTFVQLFVGFLCGSFDVSLIRLSFTLC